MRERYDVIVIGGGHAGTEAAWAAANALARGPSARYRGSPNREESPDRLDQEHTPGSDRRATGATPGSESRGTFRRGTFRVALVTMDPSRIGQMSCNPAIGGLGKGQMVREIDALGGLMGLAIDATGIMFKMLNTSKGAAVRGPRAQADKYAYAAEVQRLIATHPNVDVIAGTIDDVLVEDGRVVGVRLPAGVGIVEPDPRAIEWNLAGECLARPVYAGTPAAASRTTSATVLRSAAVVLTTGTFMRGLMHTGEARVAGGRVGEGAATGISGTLRGLGFELGRLKTGTPPRLARESIEWEALEAQCGDERPTPFSDMTHASDAPFPRLPQTECRITHTTAEAHDLIRANLHRAPMYAGQIDAECGPRYCPSIEDKIVRFADRPSHHVFLEPESLHTNEIYCNGISTSLPTDVQERMVRLMPGCANAMILKWGYAVEYDMVWPHQIDATCMTKRVCGLFLAGQINCTTGYEEAGGQGVIAGVNAARLARGLDLVRLGRDQAYLGVMMDDLVTKPPREPYRMFTSRAEHRLQLRAETADARLTPLGRELGLVDEARWAAYATREAQLDAIRAVMNRVVVDGKRLREIARRPQTTVSDLLPRVNSALQHDVDEPSARRLIERVMTEAKYDGYLARQQAEVRRQQQSDQQRIPDWLEPWMIHGLRAETAEVLRRHRPATMGQASRLPGVTPADLSIIAVAIRRGPRREPIAAEA